MNTSSKSRLVALVLVVLLGMFGIHRMYVGKVASGVAQLILTITFIGAIVSGIWVLIDFIRILIGSFTDKQGGVIREWTPTPAPQANASELEKYAELRDKGVLTEEEFQAKKKTILGA